MQQNKKITILVAEDEAQIAAAVKVYLENAGYAVLVAENGARAIELFAGQGPALAVLDRMLPVVSGDEVCRHIRKRSAIPVIMLTARATEDDKVEGFGMGADDYLTKPFSPRELVVRVQSLLRRVPGAGQALYSRMQWNGGDLEIDFDARAVYKAGRPAGLTASEYKILEALAGLPQKTFTREELIDSAFGLAFEGYERTVDSHIKNLRSKIETEPSAPQYVVTVRGIGYRFGGR
ncbi:MAG: response regulator transcription factor [Oscillospiraceae bacterium]